MRVTKETMLMCKGKYDNKELCINCKHNKKLCPKVKSATNGMTPYDLALENGFKDINI